MKHSPQQFYLLWSYVALQLLFLLPDIDLVEAGLTYKQYKFNLKADLLVLDVGGLHTLGNHPMEPLITSPQGCQGWCDRLPGCTGWTFCNNRAGCGSGCKNYAAQNPTPGGYCSTCPLDPKIKLPIKWFGPLSGQVNKCIDDKWAWGVCSLKRPANPSKPEFWSKVEAEGWVSGVVILPVECKGLSANTCRACAASKPGLRQACRNCAAAASKYGILDTVAGAGTTWTEGCAACPRLPTDSQRKSCDSCLTQGKPCGRCPQYAMDPYRQPKDYFNVADCVSCTLKNPSVYPECQACAGVSDAAKRSHCGRCITSLKTQLVQYSSYEKTARIARGDYCANCVRKNSAKVADRCIACGKAMPYNDDCYECSAGYHMSGTAARPACYDCAFKTKLGQDKEQNMASGLPSMCSECLGDNADVSVKPALKPLCKACLYDPKVTYAGRYWCNTCVENLDDPKARQKCLECLQTPGISYYFGQCVQANYPNRR